MRVVLIGGTGRCGTNLLKDILARHTAVCALPFEYRFIVDPDGLVDFLRSHAHSWSPYIVDVRLKRLAQLFAALQGGSSDPRYRGWELEKHLPGFASLSQELLAALTELSYPGTWVGAAPDAGPMLFCHSDRSALVALFRDFLGKLFAGLLARHRVEVFVEDNTWNILCADVLREIVPGGCLVHIHRDPRDVVASLRQQRWAPAELEHALRFYTSLMDRWQDLRAGLPDDFYLELGLEQLVAAPEQNLRRICAFAGLPWQASLLDADLSHAHTGRWRAELSPAEQARVQTVLRPYVEALGYATDS